MSAKTEPNTHSPAAAAAHSPAEAPAPIPCSSCKLCRSVDRAESFLAGSGSQKRGEGCEAWSLLGGSYNKPRPADRRRIQDAARNTQDAENTRDTLHGLLLAPLTVAVRTVPIPRRRRRDLPQLWRGQR